VLTPDSGQLRSLPADEAFILPRSGFVQQGIQADAGQLGGAFPRKRQHARSLIQTLCEKRISNMPEISRFLGIVIAMYYNDHAPPHFHARYGGSEIRVNIETGEILSGSFPRRAQNLVLEWLNLHRSELLEDWQLAQERKLLNKIEPLE
jgi:hypothetical protein